jgi:hypothetical protein
VSRVESAIRFRGVGAVGGGAAAQPAQLPPVRCARRLGTRQSCRVARGRKRGRARGGRGESRGSAFAWIRPSVGLHPGHASTVPRPRIRWIAVSNQRLAGCTRARPAPAGGAKYILFMQRMHARRMKPLRISSLRAQAAYSFFIQRRGKRDHARGSRRDLNAHRM